MTTETIDELILKVGVIGAEKFAKDTKKVTDSVDKTSESLRKGEKGFAGSAKQSDKLGKALKSVGGISTDAIRGLTTGMLGLAGVSIGLSAAVPAFAAISDNILKVGNASAYLGMTGRELDGINRAVEAMGGKAGDADKLLTSLQAIDGSLKNPAAYGGVSPLYTTLLQLQAESGKFIRTQQGVKATLLDTFSAIGSLKSKEAQVGFSNQLGITPAMLAGIRQGKSASLISKFTASSGQNAAAYKSAQEFHNDMTELSQSFDKLGVTLVTSFGPDVKAFVDGINKFINKSKNEWSDFFDWNKKITGDYNHPEKQKKYRIFDRKSEDEYGKNVGNIFYNNANNALRPPTNIAYHYPYQGNITSETHINTMNVTTNADNINGIIEDGKKKAVNMTAGTASGVKR